MLVGSSGTDGREADLPRSTTGSRGSQTLLNHPGSSRADSESVWGTPAAHDRLANGE
jgi:hypothetical protein